MRPSFGTKPVYSLAQLCFAWQRITGCFALSNDLFEFGKLHSREALWAHIRKEGIQ
jgi:hypothetical protein